MKFGEKVREQRIKKGLLQKDVAKGIGVTSRTLVNYEKGHYYPQDRSVYAKLADFFDVNINYFLTENEEYLTEAAELYGKNGLTKVDSILEQVDKLFTEGELSESDKIAFLYSMMALLLDSVGIEWKKFTPNKFRMVAGHISQGGRERG